MRKISMQEAETQKKELKDRIKPLKTERDKFD